ncbi:MAG TPA: adenylyl-sulfate kinase, partial [Alphaproteobacteria bacterium]|nr:adenylyl-sulfate kinase [Alphaproteobacteria bacterium]
MAKTNVKTAVNNSNPEAANTDSKEQMKIVIVGHVDHGKSTLIGRLFHDTDSLPDGKVDAIKASCQKRGMPFEYSFLMDALQAERDQGITIDTTQLWFKTQKRNYVIIDAPGHKEFLKNMISGAASSEAAVLVIDAKEGVKEQSKRHGYLLSLLGVKQIAVAVNKMDLVGYSEEKFKEIEAEYRAYLKQIDVEPTFIIPISGREGDHIITKSDNMKWYKGPSILEALDLFKPKPTLEALDLRLPVQDVYKFDERRIIAGRIESGQIKVGDEIIFSPSNRVVKVNSIESWPEKPNQSAQAGQSIGITLSEQIFAERGQVVSHKKNAPVLTNVFRGKIFWLGDNPIKEGNKYIIKINTSELHAEVKKIEKVIDTGELDIKNDLKEVAKNSVAEVVFRIRGVAALDEYAANEKTGRFVIIENFRTVGGGIIDLKGFVDQRIKTDPKSENLTPVNAQIDPARRAMLNGHKGGVLWFSGLSGSGKSTLAVALQQKLFEKGYQVFVLDGDNIRTGLNSDLGFEPKDRSENIRRVGEVAALFANSGTIVITAFISPYKSDRDKARIASGDHYHSIYIKADVETCKKRDPKGLYKKAIAGEIKQFTGVSDKFEEPENADLV